MKIFLFDLPNFTEFDLSCFYFSTRSQLPDTSQWSVRCQVGPDVFRNAQGTHSALCQRSKGNLSASFFVWTNQLTWHWCIGTAIRVSERFGWPAESFPIAKPFRPCRTGRFRRNFCLRDFVRPRHSTTSNPEGQITTCSFQRTFQTTQPNLCPHLLFVFPSPFSLMIDFPSGAVVGPAMK